MVRRVSQRLVCQHGSVITTQKHRYHRLWFIFRIGHIRRSEFCLVASFLICPSKKEIMGSKHSLNYSQRDTWEPDGIPLPSRTLKDGTLAIAELLVWWRPPQSRLFFSFWLRWSQKDRFWTISTQMSSKVEYFSILEFLASNSRDPVCWLSLGKRWEK